MQISYSFIIPVYNRPDEIMELLTSFVSLKSSISFEVVIVEDGSTMPSESIVNSFKKLWNVKSERELFYYSRFRLFVAN